MTKIWLKLQLHFSQKTTTKTKLKSAVKINTDLQFWMTGIFFIAGTAPYFSIKGCANPALNWALFIKRSSTNTLVKLHCCPKKHTASTVHITLGSFGKLNKVLFFLQPKTNFFRDILPEQCIWMKRVDVLLLLSLWSMCARAFSSSRNAHIRSSTLVYVSKSHDWKNFLKLVRSRK